MVDHVEPHYLFTHEELDALHNEDVCETLGELADLAWLSTVSVLREKPSTASEWRSAELPSTSEARLNHHVELLNTYIRAAGEDLSSLKAEELVSKFGMLLSTRKTALPKSADTFLHLYQILYAQLKTYQPNCLQFAFYLNLADICFEIMSTLES